MSDSRDGAVSAVGDLRCSAAMRLTIRDIFWGKARVWACMAITAQHAIIRVKRILFMVGILLFSGCKGSEKKRVRHKKRLLNVCVK
jgi:hypothetical protein